MSKRHANRVGSLESLFVRLEELVLASSGEDEFEEIFKLVIAKLWDETSGKVPRFRRYPEGAETHAAITKLLAEADRSWPGILETKAPALAHEHLAICVEALAPHRIADESLEVIDGLFEYLAAKESKGAKGQYFTPRYVAEFCVRMLAPDAGETILDPACGSGGFLVQALNYVARRRNLTRAARARFCATKLFGFDVDARAVRVAKVLLVLAGRSDGHISRLNSLRRKAGHDAGGDLPSTRIEDVMRKARVKDGFDVIVTNPPFAGDVRDRDLLDAYELARGTSNVERDVLFIERCVDLLRPGGRMAIVLPHNKLAATSQRHVRRWLLGRARVLAVVGLGRHTFLPHTHQKAGVLFVQRDEAGKRPADDYNIFFSVSQKDGKNSKGQPLVRAHDALDPWSRIDHDLAEIVDGFRRFCETEKLSIEGSPAS